MYPEKHKSFIDQVLPPAHLTAMRLPVTQTCREKASIIPLTRVLACASQVQKGDFSGSTGDASIDPEKGQDSCVSAPVVFL
jgi:hypothetical protein